ncbi:Smr/MutS family protein [Cytophagales bacterium LB-30]|uniref:Endonuclease MutS2 n=1 Tax=Shiella aurantiaca TaxID=3058365 RepID=A0ABT8F193_9BACT|nr:Smr/MutS family protein [Shiella aurantiaca]MDN4164212.1 Smr/MutS family protein [Shiella aurantiaca]
MLYPVNIEQKLGFDKVRELVAQECISAMGVSFVHKMRFSTDFELINRLLGQAEEFRRIVQASEPFPSTHYIDVNPYLNKAAIEGAFLMEEEFQEIILSLQSIFSAQRFLDERQEKYPLLFQLGGLIEADQHLLSTLRSKIDDQGKVRDNASPELAAVRKRMQEESIRLRKVMDSILRSVKSKGYADSEVTPTVRGGRMVIPILAEHKRHVKGFIHDESATGQTVFMEPAEVLEINNEIRELEYKEKREIIKILTLLTNQLRPHIPALRKAYQFLGLADFIRAKAKFALKINAALVQSSKSCEVKWVNARHPLLYLAHQQQGKPTVPLQVQLHENQRVLVISGPNAGGKSVCLKTIGLLQYMHQSGLLVSASEGSTFGLFRNVFIDIGDEQSIENDLSTYSSHLRNMKHFTEFADKKTLFLIDEFGTGTDPQFGGPIAEAVLEELYAKKAFGVVNTHYSNLKQFAEKNPAVVNGAMRFDNVNLEPLFELEMGKPGSSFALEIASKTGLPQTLIQKAQSKIGYEKVNYDKLLRSLEAEKQLFEQKRVAFEKEESRLKKASEEYNQLKEFIENERKQIINKAKQEAKELLKEANQKIETTIRTIKEKGAEKETTKQVRKSLEDFGDNIKVEKSAKPQIVHESGEIVAGDYVQLTDNETVGEVLSVKGKSAEIMLGGLKSTIKINRLQKISKRKYKEALGEQNTPLSKGINLNQRMAEFSPNLDLRGKRGEEALTEVQNFMDNALLFSMREVRIIHGKGDGILRSLVRNYLQKFPHKKSVSDEHADRGGAGVTIVVMA